MKKQQLVAIALFLIVVVWMFIPRDARSPDAGAAPAAIVTAAPEGSNAAEGLETPLVRTLTVTDWDHTQLESTIYRWLATGAPTSGQGGAFQIGMEKPKVPNWHNVREVTQEVAKMLFLENEGENEGGQKADKKTNKELTEEKKEKEEEESTPEDPEGGGS